MMAQVKIRKADSVATIIPKYSNPAFRWEARCGLKQRGFALVLTSPSISSQKIKNNQPNLHIVKHG